MRIVQITDLHIGHAEQFPFEVDVRANFLNVLNSICKQPFDLLVISGDLCYDEGETEIYQWIREELEKRNIPYRVIPGNHDDTDLMVEVFELRKDIRNGELFYTNSPEQPPLIYLNSGPGTVSAKQLELLQNELKRTPKPVCIFIHHPPVLMGAPYMDNNHALRDRDALLELLAHHPYPITIFAGHYHIEKSVRWKNLDIHITPSCFFQINWRATEFEVDHHRCAYRIIDWDGQCLHHAVVYL